MALIEVQNLEKKYNDQTTALQGVTFSVTAGEFVAIIGPSGSGKSTLLHILGSLDYPSGGNYLINGKSLADYNLKELTQLRNQHFGFVFQAFNLLPKTSVLNNVKLPLLYSKIPEFQWHDRALAAIKAVGLEHRLNHHPSQLSGGEKQRVAIARALVNNPQVIFADEPTGNLDSRSSQVVIDILQRLNREHGHTIILITHETFTAQRADRIIKIFDGRVVSDEKVNQENNSVATPIK